MKYAARIQLAAMPRFPLCVRVQTCFLNCRDVLLALELGALDAQVPCGWTILEECLMLNR